jgi:hypothetical protein
VSVLDGWLAFDAGVAAFCGLAGLRWILHTLIDWHAERRSRRELEAWRRRLGSRG